MIHLDLALKRGDFCLQLQAKVGAPSSSSASHSNNASIGIVGPSGSGKSSLLHALAGLVPVQHLRLSIDGETLVDTAAGRNPPPQRRGMGLVFQDHRLFPHLSVAANLRYGLQPGGPAWDEVIQLLDIGELLERHPHQCSGGQRQRIAIGRALLSAPRLLLLDEPLANLDQARKQQILPYLRRIREALHIPLLMVSHDLQDLLTVVDELLLIEGGQLLGHGSLEHLCADPDLLPRLHAGGLVCPVPGRIIGSSPGHVRVRLDGPAKCELICRGSGVDHSPVQVLLRPDDMALALPPLNDALSMSNRLLGRIDHITRTPQRCLVIVAIGAERPLLVDIVPAACDRLGLSEGKEVFVLAKAQAVLAVGDEGGTPLS